MMKLLEGLNCLRVWGVGGEQMVTPCLGSHLPRKLGEQLAAKVASLQGLFHL